MDFLRDSMGPFERCRFVGDSTRIPTLQKMIQEFRNFMGTKRLIHPDEAVAFWGARFCVVGRHSTVHGVGDSQLAV